MSAWYFEGPLEKFGLHYVNTTAHPTERHVELELLNFRGDLARIREGRGKGWCRLILGLIDGYVEI